MTYRHDPYDPKPAAKLGQAALDDALAAAEKAFAAAADPDTLAGLRHQHLGDRAPVSLARREIGGLPPAARAAAGQRVNATRAAVQAAYQVRMDQVRADQRRRVLAQERVDVTLPTGRRPRGARHPLTTVMERIEDLFVGMGYEVAEGPEAELEWFNFDALNIGPDHPSRTTMDTFYLDTDGLVLRTHTVIFGSVPVWVALISHVFGLEKMNIYKTLGVVSAFAGIIFIVTGGDNPLSLSSDTFLGDLIIILATIIWGGYTILSKGFLTRYSPIQFSAVMSTVGFITLFLIGLPGLLQTDWSSVSLPALGGVFYSGLGAIGAAYLIWNYGIQTIGAVHTSTYQNLVPVLGLLFGVILLGEDLTWLQYFGSALVVAGIVLARRKKKNEKVVEVKNK